MWQYGSPGKSVVFDFRMGREGEGPKQFLRNFNGLFQTDGYRGDNHVDGPKMVHACCLAHARRKYVGAVKVNANDQESARIVALMDDLFATDCEARQQNMDHAKRNLLRQQRAPQTAGTVARRRVPRAGQLKIWELEYHARRATPEAPASTLICAFW